MKLSDLENEIIDGMARAFFVSAWAEREEERRRTYSGQDLMDVAPKTPRYARDRALMFAGGIKCLGMLGNLEVALNEAALADVLRKENITDIKHRHTMPHLDAKVEELKDSKYANEFGHYIAMQGLGHGVSWFDNHAKFDITIPDVEFYL